MSAATSKADNLVLSNGKTSQQLIMGKANTFKAKAGEHYRILKHQEGVAEQLVDDLIAKRSGNDLQLHYADGTEVNLENYFTECDGASCDMTLPGDHGSEFKLSGDSATGAALGDGSHLVYVHGSHDVVLDMAQSNSALLSTLSGNNGAEITYIPPADHDAVAWAGGAALLLGGVALASGGGNDAVPPPAPAPVNNIVTVSVVAGPVIETNGLTVNLYKADGTTLLGSGKLSATGTFTFDVGSYTGVVIAKVQDNDSGPSMADYIDEATGQARDLTANLMTVGVVNTGVVNLNINVLTTIAATKAGAVFDGVGAKPVTADVVVQTNTAVANAFGLADLTGSPVVTTVNTSGTANASFTPDSLSVAEKYGAVLAAFSGMDTTNGGNMQTAIDSVTAGLNVTGSTAVLNTTVLDSLVVGARAAAVNTNGTGDTSLSAVISGLTVKTSSSVSINHVATDDVVAINEPNSVISGTNAAGATVILSIGGQNQTAVVTGTTWTYTLTASDITAMGQGGETITATATLTSGETATATRSIVVDTVPPTVQISSNDTQLTAGEAATLTFTLSDAAKDFAASDIVVTGGVLSNFTGSGKIYTATFTPTPNSSVPATINVAGNSFTSSSGNLNLPATELTLSVDTTVNAVPVITSGATASVAENTATSAVVYTARATDADAGTVLSYSLSGTDAAAFNINSATGVVTFIAPANFETKSSYSFNVIASDGKASSTPQAVTLTVNNLDEVAPSITSSATAAAINENSGAGRVIYTATSTDVADTSTGTTVYSLKAATGDVALLSINSSTGAVTLAGNPNFEVKANYSFTVVATDAAGNASEKAVTLAVNNLDEVAPSITSSATATAVNENIGAGQVIYTATSTDVADIATGSTVYSLKAATGDVALLSINSSTGAVTLTGNPNFELKANYSFTVVATDAAGNASEKAVTLAVNNLDEVAPAITSGTTATAINENSGAGQVIYTATSTDVADIASGSTVYSLKAATGDVALLSINSSTGAVTLTGNPDFEVKGSYSFTVVATDAAGNASEKAVTLAINNLDEVAPSITSGTAATAINENSGAGQVIYTATSTDVADIATGATVYSLKAATGDVALLSINSSTGAVTLTGNPDFETKANYSFTVVATDAVGNASEKAVTLAVNNLDEVAPSITSSATATAVNENIGAGQVIYTATSTDVADIATGATVYSLKAATGDVALLSINSSTGAVTLTGNPDFETKANYSFTVVATDAAGNASEKAVTLAVNNLDEVAPSITSSATATAINENSGAGQLIYTATSTDVADTSTGATVYSLKAATGDVALLSINSSTGAVTLTGNPDFEVKGSYSFTVVATDAAGNASEKAVTLAVNNLDEVAPSITSGTAATAINENSGAGQVIYTATSTDVADIATGATVYSLKAATGDVALLSINSSTGAVTLTGNPDFETKANYSFTVVATDAVGNASEKAVTLAVNNLDEVAPSITSGSAATAINENSGAGQVIYTATSTDVADIATGATVYSLKAATGDVALLSINSSTGAVTLTGNPDFETKANYSFTVVATDAAGNASEKAVTLAVNNLDEVAPSITSGTTATAINENSGAGQVIYTATSTDVADIATGSTVYSLKAATGDVALLSINSSTGAVTLTGNPDFETKANYSFTVVATDAAGNASEKAVSLAINDLVDETPPQVGSVVVSSASGIQNSTLNAGDVVSVTVTMDEATVVNTTGGTPRIALNIGGTTVYASYASGSGTTALVFQYTVQAGQTDVNGISIDANSLSANGGTLRDAAGNAATLTHIAAADNAGFLVDTTAPTANFTSATDDVGSVTGTLISGARTDDTSLVLAGTCEAGSMVNVYNGATLLGAATVSGTSWSYSAAVVNGTTYQFNVKESDLAGNTSAATSYFTVTGDTLAPTANLTSATDDVGSVTGALVSGARTDDTSLALAGTCEAGSTVNIYNGATLLGAATVSGTSWSYNAAITDGTTYQFNAKETDIAGNTSAATSNFTVIGDTTPPTANLTSATDDIGSVTGALISGARTDDTSLALAGTCEAGSTVKIYDGATLLGSATVSGTSWSYSAAITDGTTYQFNAKETDSAGNTSAATSNFTVIGDTTPPTAHFTSATDDAGSLTGTLINGARTDDTSLALTGTCEAGSTVNVYNGATLLGAATVSGTTWSYTATLVNGTTYQFNEKETDAAGNTSVATSNFAVTGDTSVTAHLTSVTDNVGSITGAMASGGRTDDSSLVLAGTCEAGSIVYIYDGASLIGAGTVTGTSWTYTASIADGTSYLFNVTENDVAGNHSAHTSNFAVTGDTNAPVLTGSSPLDNAIGVAVNSNIVLTFNENVLAGSGNIVISNGGADVRTISIADSSQVSISGGVVTINPTADLAGGTHYDVTMSAGVITDTAGNSFTGIAQDTRDFNTAAALNSSIVVFDLVQGVSSAHSSRTFAAGVDYTIYIRVSSGNAPLAHSGAHGDTWGQWSGANNLDANDKVVLVGSGQSVYIASGQAVNARGQGSGPGTIQWGRLGGLSSWAANLTNTGLFRRNFSGNPVGGATMSNGLYLWHAGGGGNNGPWANINGFPGKATGALWMNALPANVLTTQGLAS